MNGSTNTNGYAYYECYSKKNKHQDCDKRNVKKEFIERLVVQDAITFLTPEYIEKIATIACERNRQENEENSPIPALRDKIHQVELSLTNLTKAIETGAAPDTLVQRMRELEKEKKGLQGQMKKETANTVSLEKREVIYWLNNFKNGDLEDEGYCQTLIDLFVNSVTLWDDDDGYMKVTIAYNLTSLPTKTYRLGKDGRLSDFDLKAPVSEAV